MRLLVINPNTTEAMTAAIAEQARAAAGAETEIVAISAPWGPASIEGHVEEALSGAASLHAVAERAAEFDGVVISCYGDPGLYAARELSPVPVVGIAEASMLLACTVGHSFSVVTVIDRFKPLVEDVVGRYGLSDRCASVRGTPLAVLDIERDPARATQMIVAESRRAVEEDGAEAICLGCAGMGPLEQAVRDELEGVPVIDGVAAAVALVEADVRLGLATSRRAAFKLPEPKQMKGEGELLDAIRSQVPGSGPTVEGAA